MNHHFIYVLFVYHIYIAHIYIYKVIHPLSVDFVYIATFSLIQIKLYVPPTRRDLQFSYNNN